MLSGASSSLTKIMPVAPAARQLSAFSLLRQPAPPGLRSTMHRLPAISAALAAPPLALQALWPVPTLGITVAWASFHKTALPVKLYGDCRPPAPLAPTGTSSPAISGGE